jgi:hypothetical protein
VLHFETLKTAVEYQSEQKLIEKEIKTIEYFLPFFVDISPGLNEIIILAESEICLQLHFLFLQQKKS